MKLETALDLIAKRLNGDDFEPFGEDLGTGHAAAIKLDSDGSQTFVHLWQEPSGEFSVVTQFTSRRLHKDLRLSAKFEKLLKKQARSLLKRNLSLAISDGKLVGTAAFVREGVDLFDLGIQEVELRGAIRDLLFEAEKRLKSERIFEHDDR